MPTIDQRDLEVMKLVAQFKQLTSAHIRELLFYDLASPTSCYRTLRRLVERKYLAPMEWRLIGGMRGGSGQVVYQLGLAGWRLLRDGPYKPARAISYHTLEVAGTHLAVVELARAGRFTIERYAVESNAWFVVNGQEVKPDYYVETRAPNGRVTKSNVEVDLGSEGEKQVKGKLAANIYAHKRASVEQFPDSQFPRTIWVTPDAPRAVQLTRWVNQLPIDERALFKICERDNLADMYP